MADCSTCNHVLRSEFEEPCCSCKNNFVSGTHEYETAPLLWEDANTYGSKITHPSHYNQGNIECIDAMVAAYGKEAVENFCLCNAFKYVWRNRDKGGFEDIDKATWYLNKYKELVDSE
jgi:hypothetical protein